MNAYAILEPLLVGVIIAASIGFALRRFAPRLLARLGAAIRRAGLPAWLGELCGKPVNNAGCSSGCSSCSSCGSIQNKQIVVLHRSKPEQTV